MEDAHDFNTFFKRPSSQGGANRGQRNVWIGLVASWSKEWPTQPAKNWQEGWHAWVFALVKNPQRGQGKHLMIWDCDAELPGVGFGAKRPQEQLLGLQTVLYRRARDLDNIDGRLWLGTTPGQGGKNRCLRYSADWLRTLALGQDSGSAWQEIPDDPDQPDGRFPGFLRFQYL